MANHASAEKRARQNEVRRLRNRGTMSTMKTSMKKVHEAIAKNDVENLDKLFIQAQATIAKARKKGVIHTNNMARKISRLAATVNKAKANLKG